MVLGWVGIATAAPFPDDSSWRWLSDGGTSMGDVTLDAQSDIAALDLAGESGGADLTAGGLAWFVDAEAAHFRLRLKADPTGLSGQWVILLDSDGDPLDFECALLATGPDLSVSAQINVDGTDGTWVTSLAPATTADLGSLQSGAVRLSPVTPEDTAGQWLLDLQIPRSLLEIDLGIAQNAPIRIGAASSEYWSLGLADVGSCDPDVQYCTLLQPALSDTVYIDADLDGLTDTIEPLLGSDSFDEDSDDDGLLDGDEASDLLGDGTLDMLQCDADGDGLADGTEAGVSASLPGTDPDARCFVPDADPSSTTDPHSADSDGGGLLDGREDPDHDGAIDDWEGDPQDPADDPDSDGDAVPDWIDDLFGPGPDTDSDGDGIDDLTEGLGDSDADGIPDLGDLDSDNDGWTDTEEGAVDTDGGGSMDFRDTDSDNDGVSDSIEGFVDSDADGTPDLRDFDSDNDGIDDYTEGLADSDLDAIYDRLDLDSDSDGIDDLTETAVDTDDDGLRDAIDLDSDNDGIDDLTETAVDTDDDHIPDYIDNDSDNDGITDGNEGEGDPDCDGLVDRLDPDPEDSFCGTLSEPEVYDGVPPELAPMTPAEESGCGCNSPPRLSPLAALLPALLALRARVRAAPAPAR